MQDQGHDGHDLQHGFGLAELVGGQHDALVDGHGAQAGHHQFPQTMTITTQPEPSPA